MSVKFKTLEDAIDAAQKKSARNQMTVADTLLEQAEYQGFGEG